MERFPLINRINILKMVTLLKAMYRFKAIPIKIAAQFLAELESTIPNFTRKNKCPSIVKTILYNKRTSGGITTPDFTLYYRAMVIKTI